MLIYWYKCTYYERALLQQPMTPLEWLSNFNTNPELRELEHLSRTGVLGEDREVAQERRRECDGLRSLPSFESFFGQCSEVLYYSPHIKIFFAPFLASAVGSLGRWALFFQALFMGGTVEEALGMLQGLQGLQQEAASTIHIRSPILLQPQGSRNNGSNSSNGSAASANGWGAAQCRRSDAAGVQVPQHMLPLHCYLAARPAAGEGGGGKENGRTWTSELFHRVYQRSPTLAAAVKQWTLGTSFNGTKVH